MGTAYQILGVEHKRLMLVKEGEVIATAIVRFYRRLKIFREAWISHGPVFQMGASEQDMLSCLELLRDYLYRNKRVIALQFTPYYNAKTGEKLLPTLEQAGFTNCGQALDMDTVNHLYIRRLDTGESLEEIISGYEGNLRRALPKVEEYGLSCRNLPASELEHFFKILDDTADRKEFFIQDLNYFQAMKRAFGEDCLLALVELDRAEFIRHQSEFKAQEESELKELEGATNRKAEGQRKEALKRLKAIEKRLAEAEEINCAKLPLAALFCLKSPGETTTVFGGRYQRFNYTRANSILNHELLAVAYAEGRKRFNFYGTLELAEASEGFGNYEFKKSFGGEIEILMGKFRQARWPGKVQP